MKIEVRCPSCGRGYLVEESRIPPGGGPVACKACGGAIELPSPHPAAPPRPAPSPPAPQAPAPKLSSSDPVPEVVRTDPVAGSGEVVCPRCGLHFDAGSAAPSRASAERPGVLVVEDLEYFFEIAHDALAARFDVHAARSLREARHVLASRKIDAIVLDLTLENGENGLNLLRELRPKPCPVIIYTAEDETELYGESWERMRALGADDLVLKGMNAGDALVAKIAILLGEADPSGS